MIHLNTLEEDPKLRDLRAGNPPARAGNIYLGLIPGLGQSPGGGHGNPLQLACLEIPGTEEPDVHRITESDTTEAT